MRCQNTPLLCSVLMSGALLFLASCSTTPLLKPDTVRTDYVHRDFHGIAVMSFYTDSSYHFMHRIDESTSCLDSGRYSVQGHNLVFHSVLPRVNRPPVYAIDTCQLDTRHYDFSSEKITVLDDKGDATDEVYTQRDASQHRGQSQGNHHGGRGGGRGMGGGMMH